jgi:hypothetical protein
VDSFLGDFLHVFVFGMPFVGAVFLRSSCVIWVGLSFAGPELHRIVSSNPGAEKIKVRLIGSVPVSFKLIQVLLGMNASPPA